MGASLAGKVVLLTGASKGIGAAVAAAIGAEGAALIAHYGADRAGAEAATQAIPEGRKTLIGADLSSPKAAEELWREAVAAYGRIDVLVNNAAVMLWDGGFDAADALWERTWQQTLAVNVFGPARLMRSAVRHFLPRGGGVIVTVSSWSAQRGSTNPGTIAYASSKAAIKAATQTLARAYATQGVLAYVVAPGVVRTQMSENFAATQGGEAAVTAGLAMREWVPPGDVGALVALLAAGRLRHLSGATLDVNGASYMR